MMRGFLEGEFFQSISCFSIFSLQHFLPPCDFFQRLFLKIGTFSRDFFGKCRFWPKIECSILKLVFVYPFFRLFSPKLVFGWLFARLLRRGKLRLFCRFMILPRLRECLAISRRREHLEENPKISTCGECGLIVWTASKKALTKKIRKTLKTS